MRIYPNSSGTASGRQAAFLRGLPSERRRSAGFTLLEMMMVMVVVTIMAAIAIPAFADWQERQTVKSAANAVMSQLKQARMLAVAENRNVTITFTSTSYVLDANVSGSCSLCKNESIDLGRFSGSLVISPVNNITFSSRGTTKATSIKLSMGNSSQQIKLNIIGRAYFK